MTAICGIGWVRGREWGGLRLRQAQQAAAGADLALAWRDSGVFASPVRNFARLNSAARLACFAGALALRDAGETYASAEKTDTALLGTDDCGSLRANEEYFRDYVSCGRALARGALFVYTLPSSGLAEAAIHFGFQGPLLYMGGGRGSIAYLLQTAAAMIEEHETEAALVMSMSPAPAISFCLRRDPADGFLAPGAVAQCACRAPDAESLLASLQSLGESR